jgi:hypothetical protein
MANPNLSYKSEHYTVNVDFVSIEHVLLIKVSIYVNFQI